MGEDRPGAGTLAVWGGEDEYLVAGATQVPIVNSVAFGYHDLDVWQDTALGHRPSHIYSRNINPTVAAFEEEVRRLEGAEWATSFATGMAAISNTLFTLLSPGDRVVSLKDTYGGTNKLFTEFLPRFGIEACLCDTTDHDAVEAQVAAGCRVLYLETPTTPTLKVVDIAHRAANLGAVETVAGPPATTSHVECTPEERAAMGIPESLVRYSVGIEDTADLIADLGQALA